MTYQDQAVVAYDQEFTNRVEMCIAEQAQVFVNDGRPEYYLLAQTAIADLAMVRNQMVPLIATRPGMTAASTDGDIMAAVQYVWPMAGARYVPPPPPQVV